MLRLKGVAVAGSEEKARATNIRRPKMLKYVTRLNGAQ